MHALGLAYTSTCHVAVVPPFASREEFRSIELIYRWHSGSGPTWDICDCITKAPSSISEMFSEVGYASGRRVGSIMTLANLGEQLCPETCKYCSPDLDSIALCTAKAATTRRL